MKGHSVIDRSFNADAAAVDAEGYFDTGDLAHIDEAGTLTICGRAKHLIKSGGEWINPVEIEELVSHHPGVGLAAVIGRFDEKWGERPVLIVEPRRGQKVDSMPIAATGKIDKNRLRIDNAEQ